MSINVRPWECNPCCTPAQYEVSKSKAKGFTDVKCGLWQQNFGMRHGNALNCSHGVERWNRTK